MRDSKGKFIVGHTLINGSERGWFQKGVIPWITGKKHSAESIEKMRKSQRKRFENKKLLKNTMYDVECPLCKKTRGLRRVEYLAIMRGVRGKMCFKCLCHSRKGKKIPKLNGSIPWNKGLRGVLVAWNKGTSKKTFSQRISHTQQWKDLRKSIFERDDYTCQKCRVRGGILHPHHIKPKATHPELVFESSNITTLCRSCHKQTDTWGNKLNKERCKNVKQVQVS